MPTIEPSDSHAASESVPRNDANASQLQRFTLTCGHEERFSIVVSLLPRASIVYDNK